MRVISRFTLSLLAVLAIFFCGVTASIVQPGSIEIVASIVVMCVSTLYLVIPRA